MDKASYHNRYTEESKSPKTNWKKEEIVQWLLDQGESQASLSGKTIPELLKISKKYYIEKKFIVDEILATKDITVLRLPTKHCEYNPIELVWAKVKGYIAEHNTGGSKKQAHLALVHEAFSTITPQFCANVVQHCFEVMDRAMEAEKLIDVRIRPIIISTADEGEDFEDDSEFREIDEGVNETISFRDPFEVAQEQRAIENAMLASAKYYNVTSVLNDVGKCQCGSKTKIKKEGVTERQNHCKSCSCVKAKRLCSELCSCCQENCLNRTDRPQHTYNHDVDDDDLEAMNEIDGEENVHEVADNMSNTSSDLHRAILERNKENVRKKESMIQDYKEAEKERKKKKVLSARQLEEVRKRLRTESPHAIPVHKVPFMSEKMKSKIAAAPATLGNLRPSISSTSPPQLGPKFVPRTAPLMSQLLPQSRPTPTPSPIAIRPRPSNQVTAVFSPKSTTPGNFRIRLSTPFPLTRIGPKLVPRAAPPNPPLLSQSRPTPTPTPSPIAIRPHPSNQVTASLNCKSTKQRNLRLSTPSKPPPRLCPKLVPRAAPPNPPLLSKSRPTPTPSPIAIRPRPSNQMAVFSGPPIVIAPRHCPTTPPSETSSDSQSAILRPCPIMIRPHHSVSLSSSSQPTPVFQAAPQPQQQRNTETERETENDEAVPNISTISIRIKNNYKKRPK